MPQSRTHQDPDQLSRPTAAEALAREEQGQRLEHARAEFRARWEAKLDRKRQLAERAWARAEHLERRSYRIGLPGPLPGLLGAIWSLLIWLCFVMPVDAAIRGCAWLYRKRAERLWREIRELGRS